MLTFNAPPSLNGETLIAELVAAGVTVEGLPHLSGAHLALGVAKTDQSKVEAVLAAHDASDTSGASPDERLAALEAKLQAVEALATKADATAQEVAAAAKNARPG